MGYPPPPSPQLGDLGPPERRMGYTSSLGEAEAGAQMCPCGTAMKSRTHVVEYCEMFKEERGELREEICKIDECVMDNLGSPLQIVRQNDRYPTG